MASSFDAARPAEMRNGMAVALAAFLGAVALLMPPFGNHGLWLAMLVFMAARGIWLGACYLRIERARRVRRRPGARWAHMTSRSGKESRDRSCAGASKRPPPRWLHGRVRKVSHPIAGSEVLRRGASCNRVEKRSTWKVPASTRGQIGSTAFGGAALRAPRGHR